MNYDSHQTVSYVVQKGESAKQIAADLQNLKVIKSSYFFSLYASLSLQRGLLQAGDYNLSPKMSIYDIAKKIAHGDSVRQNVVIYEGWDLKDIGNYMQQKGICSQSDFINLAKKDYSSEYSFLKDKPKDASLEGYLFPDTYEISKDETCESFINTMLSNFEAKLTPDLRAEIAKQNKSIFQIVTMASLLEKEVRTLDDKKIVSGILWKRIDAGMPLQLDATVNYVTDGNDPSVSIKDTKIDSPYNTYMYKGLPKGPISNPGLDSIMAAIYPTATKYWFYLSDGKTYFSETLDQHNTYKAKYLR